jgi:hypothetical protein
MGLFNRDKCKNCCNIRRKTGMLVYENYICLDTMRYVSLDGWCKNYNKITKNVIKNLQK